jgi:cell cycle serine/threonine-protein kinase CDC5/MSD2
MLLFTMIIPLEISHVTTYKHQPQPKTIVLESPFNSRKISRGGCIKKSKHASVYNCTILQTDGEKNGGERIVCKIFSEVNRENLTEIEIHKNLSHPNVVDFVGASIFKHKACLMLEPCIEDMNKYIKRKGCLSEEETFGYMDQVSKAVYYLHSYSIVHRDIKPANVFMCRNGVVKLGDFGFSKRLGVDRIRGMCGTPNYLSPEVLEGCQHIEKSDVWSIGVMTYVLRFGTAPFADPDGKLEPTYRNIKAYKWKFPDGLQIGIKTKCVITECLAPLSVRTTSRKLVECGKFK